MIYFIPRHSQCTFLSYPAWQRTVMAWLNYVMGNYCCNPPPATGTALLLSIHWPYHTKNASWKWSPTIQTDQEERCKRDMLYLEGRQIYPQVTFFYKASISRNGRGMEFQASYHLLATIPVVWSLYNLVYNLVYTWIQFEGHFVLHIAKTIWSIFARWKHEGKTQTWAHGTNKTRQCISSSKHQQLNKRLF